MTDLALSKPVDQTQMKRIAHGAGALIISLGFLLMFALAVETMIGPKMSLLASLKSRAQSIEALETALTNQQAALRENFALIGVKPDDGPASLSSTQIVKSLVSEIDGFTSELEALGFTLNNRSDTSERPVTPTLSVYAITVNFAGDDKTAAALMSAPIVSDAPIIKLGVNGEGASGGHAVNLTLDIQRIGLSTTQDMDAPDE